MYRSQAGTTRPSVINTHIRVLDINDHSPYWPGVDSASDNAKGFTLEIAEHSTPNTEYRIPEAVDPDKAPENTTQRYFIRNYPDNVDKIFDIRTDNRADASQARSRLRLVLLTDLDRELTARYRFSIVAMDGGHPARTGELAVVVEVTDINDHPPVFVGDSSPVVISLPEDSPINRVVHQFRASDVDSNDKSRLKYVMGRTAPSFVRDTFWLKEQSGELSLQKYLDYETHSSFRFSVEVSDGKHIGSVEVRVTVLNVNDNAPRITIQSFEKRNGFSVAENLPRGQHIGAVVVTDEDDRAETQAIRCSITAGADSVELAPLFEGALSQFVLVTSRSFDREQLASVLVTVSCEDGGRPRRSSELTARLTILDRNDNAPTFAASPMTASVRENAPVGTVVYQVRALDNDSSPNADFHFSLESDSGPSSLFSIQERTGQIFTRAVFDAEETQDIKVNVQLCDQANKSKGHTVHGVVHVSVTDVNDHAPVFQRDIYHLSVVENARAGTLIDRVTATDGDVLPQNSAVRFRFKSGTDAATRAHLSVTETGKIYVQSLHLDRETTSSFTFYVVATDSGHPTLSSSAYVQIEVKDTNDNAPHWIHPASPAGAVVNITYRLPVGAEITRLQAADPDLGPNSELEFYLAQPPSPPASGLFQLQPSTGVLYVARTMTSSRDVRQYRLVLGVRDRGRPAMSKLCSLRVNVLLQLARDGATSSRGRSALFGKFEGDLLVILILVIVTLVICLGLISAIWFLKCGRRPGMAAANWLGGQRHCYRDSMRPPDGHSPSPSNEIMPVFLGHHPDSFISNLTKTTLCDRSKISESAKGSGTQQRMSPAESHCLNNKMTGHYQCLRHINRDGMGPELSQRTNVLTRHNSIAGEHSPRAHSVSPHPHSASGQHQQQQQHRQHQQQRQPGEPKALTLPLHRHADPDEDDNQPVPTAVSSTSQLSVHWLQRDDGGLCDPRDAEDPNSGMEGASSAVAAAQGPQYQICISSSSTTPKPHQPPPPRIRVTRSPYPTAESDYTPLSATTTTFKITAAAAAAAAANRDSSTTPTNLPLSYV